MHWVLKTWFAGAALAMGMASPVVQAEEAPGTEGVQSEVQADSSVRGDDRDPLERLNRAVFRFNETLDDYVLRPVAVGYRNVVPNFLDTGITNIFQNLGDVGVLVNSLLQLKGEKAAITTSRVTFNTTFGLLGFFDLASHFGLPKQDEDFGQTLGYWGIGPGPYLMLPLLGPSTVRDGVGRVPDALLEPLGYMLDGWELYAAGGLEVVDKRADLIPAEGFIIGDKYLFIRNAYLQRREFLVHDGAVEDPFAEEEFDEDFEF